MTNAVHKHCTRPWYMRPPVWILGLVLLGLAAFGIIGMINRPPAIAYGDFLDQLDAGNVAGVTFAGTQIDGTFKHPVAQTAAKGSAPQINFRTEAPSFGDTTLLPELREKHVAIDVASSSNWASWLGKIPWPMVLIIAAVLIAGLVRLMRGEKASAGSALPAHPMIGLIRGLFGKKDEASRPAGGGGKTPPVA